MEIEDQNHFSNPRKSRQSNTDSSSISSSHIHLRDHHSPHSPPTTKSPEYSPARSSISSSDLSSLSHGVSPARDQLPEQQQQQQQQQRQHRSPELTPAPFRHPPPQPLPVPIVNRYVIEEPVPIKKSDRGAQDGFVSVQGEEERKSGGGGGVRPPRVRPATARISRTERDAVMKKAAFGFRVFEFIFCLVSLSVMATDKNKGWALDSFYRYKEFRYCMSVNVIGFVYSGVQGCNLAYQLATGDYFSRHHLWYYLDFAVDQMLTYLLISASSSAAIRVDDWISNWGSDKFPETARASVGLSFVAFVAFAFSSLISGYSLCTLRST